MFMLLYDLESVEEEAFVKWKEDVNDDYPGKGRALFQVEQCLLSILRVRMGVFRPTLF